MKKSLLALAVSLAAISSGAHAAWNNGVSSDLYTGNGELILSVWDSVNQTSYSQDLGITYNQLIAGVNTSVALNSAALAIFSSTANQSSLQYSVIAASNAQYTPDYSAAALKNAGFISTLATGQSAFSVGNDVNYNFVSIVWGAATDYQSALGFGSGAQDPVKSVTAPDVGYAYSSVWETYLEANLGRDLSNSNHQQTDIWLQSFADDDGVAQLQKKLGYVQLDINGTTGSLVLNTSAVPVPAAVWLMGSALAGLGSIARKRRQAA